ncbi:MAG: carbohydrate-binding domain-containing protein [Clostridiales bacterium]|nr:carbohydrate-binding domain-containing protein [Clostridiales bacterium]
MRITKIFVGVLCLSLLFSGCSKSDDTSGNGDTLGSVDTSGGTEISGTGSTASSTTLIAAPPPAPNASANRPTRPVTATAVLADGNIRIEGDGMSADGNTLTISADGVYEVSGTLTNGQIIIDAPKTAIVELVLSDVDISNGKNAAIYYPISKVRRTSNHRSMASGEIKCLMLCGFGRVRKFQMRSF